MIFLKVRKFQPNSLLIFWLRTLGRGQEQGTKSSNWEQKFQAMENQINRLQEQNNAFVAREEYRKKRIEERRQKRAAERRQEQEKNTSLFQQVLRIVGQGA